MGLRTAAEYRESLRDGRRVLCGGEMIDEVKGLAPIRGYRGLPEGDLEALAQAIVAL